MAPVEAVLDILRAAATNKERCPMNEQIIMMLKDQGYGGLPWGLRPSELARLGYIRVEIYSHNWRVVEIDGLRTAEPPRKIGVPPVKPHKVLDGAQEREWVNKRLGTKNAVKQALSLAPPSGPTPLQRANALKLPGSELCRLGDEYSERPLF